MAQAGLVLTAPCLLQKKSVEKRRDIILSVLPVGSCSVERMFSHITNCNNKPHILEPPKVTISQKYYDLQGF